MKLNFKPVIVAAAAAATFTTYASEPYKVSVSMDEDDNGAMVYLHNFDTQEKIDSTIVTDKVALFSGKIDKAMMGSVSYDGRTAAVFVIEPGSTTVDIMNRKTCGSMLNDRLQAFNDSVSAIASRFRKTSDQQQKEAIYDEYLRYNKESMEENIDNPVGYYLFVSQASSMDPDEFESMLAAHPSLKESQRVNGIKKTQECKKATSPGQMFADFEVTYGEKTYRLSDYVGKGKYVLVDYWASWCGPCIRQVPVIKEILAEYGDKGLDVLGVAVWDEPENTTQAIDEHGITWPCIINAQRIPTDVYGITGIPCIILYGPDGKILSRDKQGDELKADVKAAFDGTLKID